MNKAKDTKSAEIATLRRLLHGALNGDPKAEAEAREMLYGKPE